jgi:hypothetical protein
MQGGHPVLGATLAGSAYLGVSLGIPHWVEKLAWTTFVKAFRETPDTGEVEGWNVRLEQTGIEGALEPRHRKDGTCHSFGRFLVRDRVELPAGLGTGLLIDYGAVPQGLDPIRFLRDPLVALAPDSTDWLLGWSYLDLGIPVSTPSYFLLQRVGEAEAFSG